LKNGSCAKIAYYNKKPVAQILYYREEADVTRAFRPKRIEEIIKQLVPNMKIKMTKEWEKPEEAIKRKNWWLIVDAKPIQTFFMDTENSRKK
jgi:hypothetical protein